MQARGWQINPAGVRSPGPMPDNRHGAPWTSVQGAFSLAGGLTGQPRRCRRPQHMMVYPKKPQHFVFSGTWENETFWAVPPAYFLNFPPLRRGFLFGGWKKTDTNKRTVDPVVAGSRPVALAWRVPASVRTGRLQRCSVGMLPAVFFRQVFRIPFEALNNSTWTKKKYISGDFCENSISCAVVNAIIQCVVATLANLRDRRHPQKST